MSSHEASPLRYPGGKGALSGFLGRLIEARSPRCDVYVEPYAGGAGAAVRLLLDEYVDTIVLNDLDAGIAAMWEAVFTSTSDLARMVETTDVSLDTWHEQRGVYAARDSSTDELGLGFATFFLNRTNRSGILNARPIGGLRQTGKWKIDARYNRRALAERIRRLGGYRNRVTVASEDGVEIVRRYLGRRTFVYADPPYLTAGKDLYLNAMTFADHQRLAKVLSKSQAPWMVTYDHDPRHSDLYPRQRRAEFTIAHTAARPHVGREVAVFSDGLSLEGLLGLGSEARFVGHG